MEWWQILTVGVLIWLLVGYISLWAGVRFDSSEFGDERDAALLVLIWPLVWVVLLFLTFPKAISRKVKKK